jgi:peptide deformylase
MSVRPLVIAPDERLTVPSETVAVVDDSIRALLDDMLDTMYANDGIGLAAVQIGIHKRCIVVDVGIRDGEKEPMKFVNPEVVERSRDDSIFKEGCLSFPDQYSEVVRPETVTVRYLDEHGAQKTIEATGILATCLQHEIDHTNGIVFVDHISKMKRDIILRKLKKAKRLGTAHELPDHSAV